MYVRMAMESADYLKCGKLVFDIDVHEALEGRKAIEFGLRIPTPPSAKGGRGEFDDRMIVLQLQSEDALKIVAETKFTADPAGSYQNGAPRPTYWGAGRGGASAQPQPNTPDANHDWIADLGRLHEGIYQFVWAHSTNKGPNIHINAAGIASNVLKPMANVPTERYFDGVWHFDAASYNADKFLSSYSGQTSVLQHEGYQGFTGSAGCQTFPKQSNIQRKNLSFQDFAAKLIATHQNDFIYVLRNL